MSYASSTLGPRLIKRGVTLGQDRSSSRKETREERHASVPYRQTQRMERAHYRFAHTFGAREGATADESQKECGAVMPDRPSAYGHGRLPCSSLVVGAVKECHDRLLAAPQQGEGCDPGPRVHPQLAGTASPDLPRHRPPRCRPAVLVWLSANRAEIYPRVERDRHASVPYRQTQRMESALPMDF